MRGLQVGDLEADPNRLRAETPDQNLAPRRHQLFCAERERLRPFKDPRVRQAFAYATDKQKICQVVTEGIYPVAPDLLPQGIPGGDPNFQDIPYDPAKAKALLAAAGYPDGKGLPPLDIYTTKRTRCTQKTMDILRQMYAQNLGITVNDRQMEFGSLIAAIDKNSRPASFVLAWYADYLDPQDFYSLLLSSKSPENHTGYADPQFDALCARADVERDPQNAPLCTGRPLRSSGRAAAHSALLCRRPGAGPPARPRPRRLPDGPSAVQAGDAELTKIPALEVPAYFGMKVLRGCGLS